MANPLGDFDPGTILYFKFPSVNPSTGAAFTLAGTPSLAAWKDSSVTSSTAGFTLSVDFGGITGSNHVTLDTGASASFYAAGSFFDVTIAAGTVNSVSAVGMAVAQFTLQKVSSLRPTTATRTLDVSATGGAGIDWSNVESQTTTVGLTNTTILTASALATAIAALQADLPVKITKNVAVAAFPFFMVTSATHTTGATGLTITAQRSLDGAALGACANAAVEVGSGMYAIDLAQTDTNANTIGFLFTATGADPLAFSVVTQPT